MKTLTKRNLLTIACLFAVGASNAMATDNNPADFPIVPVVATTVPSSGDVNPYGVAFISPDFQNQSKLKTGDVLVSNFNNKQNLQGTGSTIVNITPSGATSTFFQGSPGLGLTAALGVLTKGLVIVGSLPTADGTAATVQAGKLLVIDANGNLLSTISNPALVNGPWGMAIREYDNHNHAQIFVSNVLSGTVVRFDAHVHANGLTINQVVTIASGYNHRTDPAALVLGPSGLNYDEENDTLFVASSLDNAVYAISDASQINKNVNPGSTGKLVLQDDVHLHGPIDLVIAPNGHLLVANSDGSNVDPNQPSEIVEYGAEGEFIGQFSVDPNNGGAFGLSFKEYQGLGRFAFVDDNQNNITITGFVAK
ncbi:MAG: hypothetical protein ABSB19_06595 [Methylomonas sp.]|jgi:hypothetical protein